MSSVLRSRLTDRDQFRFLRSARWGTIPAALAEVRSISSLPAVTAWGSVAAADVVKFDSTTDGITLANDDSFGSAVALDDGALTIGAG